MRALRQGNLWRRSKRYALCDSLGLRAALKRQCPSDYSCVAVVFASLLLQSISKIGNKKPEEKAIRDECQKTLDALGSSECRE